MQYGNSNSGRLPELRARLRELQGNMSVTDFADKLGLSRQTVGFYLNGNRIPDSETLIQICNACHVSADWLLGIEKEDLGLSHKVVEQLIHIKKQHQELIKSAENEHIWDHTIDGINLFLESTLGTGLYDTIAMFKENIEAETQANLSEIELELSDLYSKIGNKYGDAHVMRKLEYMLIEKYPELEGRITVRLARFNLEEERNRILVFFGRCLDSMTGYGVFVNQDKFKRTKGEGH